MSFLHACHNSATTGPCLPLSRPILSRFPSFHHKPANSRKSVSRPVQSSSQRCCSQHRERDGSVGSTCNSCTDGESPLLKCNETLSLDSSSLIAITALAALSLLAISDPALASSSQLSSHDSSALPMFSLAEGEDFWANVVRYMRFFVSVMVGTGYVMLKPIGELLKKPRTAILVIGGGALAYVFLKATIESMLGLSEFDYEPSSFVTRGFGG